MVVKCVKKEMIWGNRSTNGTITAGVSKRKVSLAIFCFLFIKPLHKRDKIEISERAFAYPSLSPVRVRVNLLQCIT